MLKIKNIINKKINILATKGYSGIESPEIFAVSTHWKHISHVDTHTISSAKTLGP